MTIGRTFFGFLLTSFLGSSAFAQTIQLPTFGYTTVSTTVSVPDSGESLLGGVNTSSSGYPSLGTPLVGRLPFAGRPFGNRAIGGRQSPSVMSVRVTIHDSEAMDQALLAEAAARRAHRSGAAQRGKTTRHLSGLNPAARSVADLRRQASEPTPSARDEIQDLLARARSAEAKGKSKVARIFYRMLARDAKGELKTLALAKVEELGRTSRGLATK